MSYGVKRGVKAPGEWGVGDLAGLALAGATGIIAALVTDYQQSQEASALFTINQWVVGLGSLLGFTDIPLWMVVAGLTMLGAGSIFYFQPITRQGAFAQGFGLLAVLMTMTPADLAGGMESSVEALPGLQPASLVREVSADPMMADPLIKTVAYAPGGGAIYKVQSRGASDKYDLHLKIVYPNGISDDIDSLIRRGAFRGRIHNADTNETWSISRSAGGTLRVEGNTMYIHAGIPAESQTARIWVRIEMTGYAIEEQSAEARLGEQLDWTVTMTPSATPLFLQRLNKSYWF